jgi:hypothetical protein
LVAALRSVIRFELYYRDKKVVGVFCAFSCAASGLRLQRDRPAGRLQHARLQDLHRTVVCACSASSRRTPGPPFLTHRLTAVAPRAVTFLSPLSPQKGGRGQFSMHPHRRLVAWRYARCCCWSRSYGWPPRPLALHSASQAACPPWGACC